VALATRILSTSTKSSPLPRWHRLPIGPQPYPGSACSRFQFLKHHIPIRILPIPPAPAVFDQCVIDISSIRQKHIGKATTVFVLAMGVKRDFPSKDQF
jgi:hypothetical protein